MTDWTPEQARRTYNIKHWGGEYFHINEQGHLAVRPAGAQGAEVDLFSLAQVLREQGLTWPVLVRFTDILRHRVDTLCQAFATAIAANAYTGRYTAVYPIKVNQQHSIVEEFHRYGAGRVGLEAGSKPELMAVLGVAEVGTRVVCNGYKDREYIRLALSGLQLGIRVYIVVEKPSELELVIEEARQMQVTPLIGMRVKLASIGAGKWQNTGGEKSKFGLTATQLIRAVARLQEVKLLPSLNMLHFHLGSQLANLQDIKTGVQEAARYYAELWRLGAELKVVDVGGGLGVDYEGTRSRSFCSMNYSVEDYAQAIVQALQKTCQQQDLPQPEIFTESGRAMTAHHAMLITNVIDTSQADSALSITTPDRSEPVLHELWQSYASVQKGNGASLVETYHDIVKLLGEAQREYAQAKLSLEQRAQAEELYYATCFAIQRQLDNSKKAHREIADALNEKLASKYFCNFSLFQSLPDIWAIDQIFPIVPLQRLQEEPTARAVLEDITCDSDGRIDYYVDSEGLEGSLPVHTIQAGETYLLGIFLVGAYQEILGDMHNLFGDTDSVHVELDGEGGYRLQEKTRGTTVDEVLRYVNFDPTELLQRYRDKTEAADLKADVKARILGELEAGLHGYTYLED
ncbi:MAG: biosynthetic arginine decarboxylase [Gammaproteobacteria bacterium]